MENKDETKNLVYLEYVVIFDPSNTWASVYDFEKDFNDFFGAYGMQVKIISTANSIPGKRVLFIEKSELLERPIIKQEIQNEDKQKSMKQITSQMKQKRDFNGKFRKINGNS